MRLPLALCCLLVLVGSPLGTLTVVAQDAQQELSPEPLQVKPETPGFIATSDAFREHLKKMRRVMVRFNTQLPGAMDRSTQDEWFKLLREGLPIYQSMLNAAVAEYRLAPSEKAPLAAMLWETLDRNTKIDLYEGMLPIAQALLAGGYENIELRGLAARTAFALNDYPVVRQEVTRLIDEGIASPPLQHLFEELDLVEQAWTDELAIREQDAQGEPLPRVLMRTTKGDIEIELFENQAPETVGNFISLVESGFYDGRVFHRVIEQFMAQTGCPVGDGSGGPGYNIYGEADKPNARKYFRGTLGMALSGEPDSGGSQFFITFLPVPDLNSQYTAFGRITAGIEVLGNLVRVNPEAEEEEKKKPAGMLDEIISIEVLSKRNHEYKPNKVK